MFRRGVAWLIAVVLVVVAPGLLVLPAAVAADPVVENVVTFSDVPESSQFATEISWLAASGISTGWDAGGGVRQYRPLESIARDAMAAFLYRHAGSPAFTAPAVSPFTDVPAGAAFYKEITWLAAEGISTGWDTGIGKREYRPLSPIARDAMAAFLYRYADKPAFTAPPVSPFVDVPAGGGFYAEITWLAASGISTGWDAGNGVREYRPLNGIARDAMAAFLYRYAGQKAPADPGNPAAGTVTVAPDVEVLEPAQLETALVSADTVVLPSDQALEIKPNDVLVSGVTTGTPDGLLVRVVQVARDPGGNTLVKTKPATLPEAVVSTGGLLEVAGTPVRSEFIPEPDVVVEPNAAPTATRPDMAQPFAETSADVFNKSMTFKKTVKGEFGKPDAPLTGNGSVTLKSSVTAKATAKMTLDVGFLQLKEASVVVTPSVKAEHSVTAEGSLKGQVTSKLGELNAWFTFWVGPVPVAVTADAEMNANFALDGDAQVVFSSSQTVSSGHGFKYKNGSFNLVNDKPSTAGIQNQYKASASLTVRASLDFDATIKLYGVAGITFGMGPYATTTITVTAASGQQLSWTCPLELGVEGRLGVTAGIEIMGFDLGEWEATVTKSWPLFTANPCQGTTVIQPPPTNPTPTPTPTNTPTPTSPPGPGITLPQVPVRVGQSGQAVLVEDGGDVASVQWISSPLPNTVLSAGQPTIPATLTWSPKTVETVQFSIRVTYNDGSTKDVSGSLRAYAVPAPSLAVGNLQSTYVATSDRGTPYSVVTFEITKTTASNTTPLKTLTDKEDPASDFYAYTGGDSNANNVLDIGEKWQYRAFYLDWRATEPGNSRTRTILVRANDTTGAGSWIDAEVAYTMTR
ncbi:S-layer homology domain-containing protein [Paenarthrobacter nitroguajacolicus]|uniref:S-layer homology domain-containing protein n=1 Tax=Paenarthrobacter nitroguajacolicus TaxID=211146 RepID=UPI00351D2D7A